MRGNSWPSLPVALVVVALLSAGCLGGGASGDDGEPTATAAVDTMEPTDTPTATIRSTATATADDGESGVTTAEDVPVSTFSTGESYTFAVNFSGEEHVFTWTTTEVTDGQVTAELYWEAEDSTETVSGTHENIAFELASYPKTTVQFMRLFRMAMSGRPLEDGASWTSENNDVKTDFEVIGSDTVDDVPCTVVRAQDRDRQRYWHLCVNKDHPFALSAIQFDQQDNVAARFVVTDHST